MFRVRRAFCRIARGAFCRIARGACAFGLLFLPRSWYDDTKEVRPMPFETQPNSVRYLEDGQTLAEVTFPPLEGAVVNVDHTYVSDALRGRGMAAQLMERTAAELRRTGRRAVLTCTYARRWWSQHPDQADLLK